MKIQEIIKIKELEQYLLKEFGKRCKDYSYGCTCCDTWKLFNVIKGFYKFCAECEKDEKEK